MALIKPRFDTMKCTKKSQLKYYAQRTQKFESTLFLSFMKSYDVYDCECNENTKIYFFANAIQDTAYPQKLVLLVKVF